MPRTAALLDPIRLRGKRKALTSPVFHGVFVSHVLVVDLKLWVGLATDDLEVASGLIAASRTDMATRVPKDEIVVGD